MQYNVCFLHVNEIWIHTCVVHSVLYCINNVSLSSIANFWICTIQSEQPQYAEWMNHVSNFIISELQSRFGEWIINFTFAIFQWHIESWITQFFRIIIVLIVTLCNKMRNECGAAIQISSIGCRTVWSAQRQYANICWPGIPERHLWFHAKWWRANETPISKIFSSQSEYCVLFQYSFYFKEN